MSQTIAVITLKSRQNLYQHDAMLRAKETSPQKYLANAASLLLVKYEPIK